MSDNRKKGYRPYYKKNNSKAAKNTDTEPHPVFENRTKLEMAVEAKPTEENIVTALAIAWNKYAWFEEQEEKNLADETKYREICEKTDEWCEEHSRMLEKLKTTLGFDSDVTFALPEITYVMNRNGFEDVNGYWQKKKN